MSLKDNRALFEFDKSEADGKFLAGTDEAGRGPGAGGVFAAAVHFINPDKKLIEKLSKLNDSKQLSKKTREELFEIIKANSIFSVVCVEVEEIEKINILNSSLKAMKLACENVMKFCPPLEGGPKSIDFEGGHIQKNNAITLVDGNKLIKNFSYPQKFIVKGDSKSASIAAASILAKVSRDKYMEELDRLHPEYNWKQNAGYLTKEHLAAIDKYGVTEFHRKSFLRKHFEKQLNLFK